MNSNTLIYTLLNMKGWGPTKIYNYVRENFFDYDSCKNNLVYVLDEEGKKEFKLKLIETNRIFELNLSKGIKMLNILDKDFPPELYEKNDKCVFLFYMGNIKLLSMKSIAIIGTRKPEKSFLEKGIKLTEYFAGKGYVIVSGLALGCDTIAHSACLNVNGRTIAVLPSPCDNIQPPSNNHLARKILANGGLLISEYSSGEQVSRFNFPRRDRIQSLLTSVILIIQASDASGTMIAVKKSIKDNKHIFAIEGNNISLVNKYIDVESIECLKIIEDIIK